MSDKGLRVIELQAENFKRLRAVSIRPNGSVINICGRNAQGKSSVIDAIWAVLGGAKASPEVPIRRGAEGAAVTVDLGEFIVERRWSANGSSLTVKSRDGMKYSSPQKMLDQLIGSDSFDPLAFTRAKPSEQVETLRKLVGLDFRILDTQRKTLYDNRTEANREIARMRATLETMKIVNAPEEPVSVADLLKEQDQVIARQREYEQLQRLAEGAVSRRATAEAAVARAKEALAKALREVEQAEAQLKAARDGEEEAAGELAVAEKPDLAAIREKLAKVEEINAAVRSKKDRAAAAQRLHAKEKEAATFTEKIEALDKNKTDALAAAKFPVEGLSFTDDGVTLNALPLGQASAAEQLRVSMAIALAANPRLRVVPIWDGSLLDEQSLQIVAEMAEAAGSQVWIERVSEGEGGGIVIEDGMVAAA